MYFSHMYKYNFFSYMMYTEERRIGNTKKYNISFYHNARVTRPGFQELRMTIPRADDVSLGVRLLLELHQFHSVQ